jgi:hypothetical protein
MDASRLARAVASRRTAAARWRRLAVPGLLLLAAVPALAADQASVSCEILENGKPASGTIVVLNGAAEVARGSCGKALPLPAGEYTAVLGLDGALDGPEQRRPLSVQASKPAKVSADFATGLLEVRIRSQGRDTAGMAVIRKDGRQIGTLGSGVAAHLSAGTYQVVARYRAQQKPYDDVQIKAGERTVLDASFE